jgi:site-specific recombinase
MDTIALKEEINQIVNHLPDGLLVELLEHLRKVDSAPVSATERATYLKKILQEDRQLLEKLAQ